MNGPELSERQKIELQIFVLRRQIHMELIGNNGDTANKLLDKIGKLERDLQHTKG